MKDSEFLFTCMCRLITVCFKTIGCWLLASTSALNQACSVSLDVPVKRYLMQRKPSAGAVAKYHTDIKWRQQQSEKKNKKNKNKCIKQKYFSLSY